MSADCKRCGGTGLEPTGCTAHGLGRRGRCGQPIVAEVEVLMVRRNPVWRARCAEHSGEHYHGRSRPVAPPRASA